MKNEDIKAYSSKMLHRLGIASVSTQKVRTFSNGMKKRLALAATLVFDSEVVILDEPTNGIDPESYKILVDIINSLKEEGRSLLISSHNLDFINRVATKIVIIQDGSIVYEKSMDKLEYPLEEVYLKYTKKECNSCEIY